MDVIVNKLVALQLWQSSAQLGTARHGSGRAPVYAYHAGGMLTMRNSPPAFPLHLLLFPSTQPSKQSVFGWQSMPLLFNNNTTFLYYLSSKHCEYISTFYLVFSYTVKTQILLLSIKTLWQKPKKCGSRFSFSLIAVSMLSSTVHCIPSWLALCRTVRPHCDQCLSQCHSESLPCASLPVMCVTRVRLL